MKQRFEGSLGELLPLRFDGGFVLEVLSDECERCVRTIDTSAWRIESSWIAPASCVLDMDGTCSFCSHPQQRKIRVRAQREGWACVDWHVDGAWKTAVVGNITWADRLKKIFGFTN